MAKNLAEKQEKNMEPTQENAAQEEKLENMTPEKALAKINAEWDRLKKSKVKLAQPIRIGDRVYDELEYDFDAMNGWDYCNAMSCDRSVESGNCTEKQAFMLFAYAVVKKMKSITPMTLQEQMGAEDAMNAVLVGRFFFRTRGTVARMRIVNE